MTNREEIISLLSEKDPETDCIVASFIDCPYTDRCDNTNEYGTIEFDMFCCACKCEWLDKETGEG